MTLLNEPDTESAVLNPPEPQVLVVDDETLFAQAVAKRLTKAGFDCRQVGTLADARAEVESGQPDLILLDVKLPDGSGLDLLAELRADFGQEMAIVMMTAFGDLDSAVEAMRLKANDFLKKPVDLDELLLLVGKVLQQSQLQRSNSHAKLRQEHELAGLELVGASATSRDLIRQLRQVASIGSAEGEAPPTVLIQGETGTGKDVSARALHALSQRKDQPFVHVDCASLPKDLIEAELFGHEKGSFTSAHSARSGLIEAAESGTLFLDEIGELPMELQAKLLAVLERRCLRRIGSSREVTTNAWFVAATNRPLQEMVAQGTFRADLFYRLNVLSVTVPPLRARGDDVVQLIEHFSQKTAARYGLGCPTLSKAAEAAARAYTWPGNIRELRHCVERAVLLNREGTLQPEDLGIGQIPAHSVPSDEGTLDGLTLDAAERLLIERALARTRGNVSAAARQLGVTRMVLRYRIDRHQLNGLDATAAGAG